MPRAGRQSTIQGASMSERDMTAEDELLLKGDGTGSARPAWRCGTAALPSTAVWWPHRLAGHPLPEPLAPPLALPFGLVPALLLAKSVWFTLATAELASLDF